MATTWNPFVDTQQASWQFLQQQDQADAYDTAAAYDADPGYQRDPQRTDSGAAQQLFSDDNTVAWLKQRRNKRAAGRSMLGFDDDEADNYDYAPQDDGWTGYGAMQDTQVAPEDYGSGAPNNTGLRMMQDFVKQGYTPQQAAGIVGSLAQESGNFSIMQEINPQGGRGGYGYAQWTGPRRAQFEAYARANGASTDDYETNMGFLMHERNNTPEGRTFDRLYTAPDVATSTAIFTNGYLRPGIVNMRARVNNAQLYYDAYLAQTEHQQRS